MDNVRWYHRLSLLMVLGMALAAALFPHSATTASASDVIERPRQARVVARFKCAKSGGPGLHSRLNVYLFEDGVARLFPLRRGRGQPDGVAQYSWVRMNASTLRIGQSPGALAPSGDMEMAGMHCLHQ